MKPSLTLGSFLLTLACVAAATSARADSWAAPRPKIYASQWGSYGFKVLEPKFFKDSVGQLFKLDEEGEEIVLWETRLVNVPHQVFISEDGKRVVTIDTYGRLGKDHALVVYDEHGKVLLDAGPDAFLNPIEAALFATQSVSSYHWASQCRFEFLGKSKRFRITFQWPDDAESRVAGYRELAPQI